MVLIIVLSMVIMAACFWLGIFLGAKTMEERHGKKLKELEDMVDDIADRLKNEKNAIEQVNKLKEKVDARK